MVRHSCSSSGRTSPVRDQSRSRLICYDDRELPRFDDNVLRRYFPFSFQYYRVLNGRPDDGVPVTCSLGSDLREVKHTVVLTSTPVIGHTGVRPHTELTVSGTDRVSIEGLK